MSEDLDALASRLRTGDPEAFEALVDRLEGPLLRLARGMLRDAGEAADMVQETFLALWRGAPGWRGNDLEAWAATVCLNRCRDRLRARQRERRRLEALPHPAAAAAPDALEGAERLRVLLDLVEALPDRQREALLLIGVEGYASERAGEILGCSAEAARQALAKARQALIGKIRVTEGGGAAS